MMGELKNLCCPKCGSFVGILRVYVGLSIPFKCGKCQANYTFRLLNDLVAGAIAIPFVIGISSIFKATIGLSDGAVVGALAAGWLVGGLFRKVVGIEAGVDG